MYLESKQNNLKVHSFFTLVEMVVALAVFLILIAIILNFYGSVFNLTEKSRVSTQQVSEANTALDIITRDLQCIYYKEGVTPFRWNDDTKPDGNADDKLGFISATTLTYGNDKTTSGLYEIKYKLENNELKRSVINSDNSAWFKNEDETAEKMLDFGEEEGSLKKLISNVIALDFKCFDNSKNETLKNQASFTQIPYSIRVSITLIDDKTKEGSSADIKRDKKTFTKTIFIGPRGK